MVLFFYLFEIEIVVRILFGWSFCRCILSGCRRRGRSLFARVCSTIRVRSGISSHAHLIQGSSPLSSLLVGYSQCNSWWGLVIFHVYKKFNLAVVFLVCSLDRVSAEFKCEFRWSGHEKDVLNPNGRIKLHILVRSHFTIVFVLYGKKDGFFFYHIMSHDTD